MNAIRRKINERYKYIYVFNDVLITILFFVLLFFVFSEIGIVFYLTSLASTPLAYSNPNIQRYPLDRYLRPASLTVIWSRWASKAHLSMMIRREVKTALIIT